MAYQLAGLVPVGACLAWLKSFTSVPALAPEYVECNGQVLSDAQSIYNGQTIPSLNTGTQRFLRGSSTSGTTAGVATHIHLAGASADNVNGLTANAVTRCFFALTPFDMDPADITPPYYETVFVMRTK